MALKLAAKHHRGTEMIDTYDQRGFFVPRHPENSRRAGKPGPGNGDWPIQRNYRHLRPDHLKELIDTVEELGGNSGRKADNAGSVRL
jgi:hypothetical protein